MDIAYLNTLRSTVDLWIETGRSGLPNVCIKIDKLEEFLAHVAALEAKGAALQVNAEAALYQMQANAQRMDRAESKLWSIEDNG